MKRQLKKCKGFNERICIICKRQDNDSELLVSELAEINNTKTCQYWIKK